MTLNFKTLMLFILVLSILGCTESTPTKEVKDELSSPQVNKAKAPEKIVEEENEMKPKPEKKIEKKEEIAPYTAPKNLEELLNTVYVVDTLINTKIGNETNDRDNKYTLTFNKILGSVKSINYDYPLLFAMKPIYNINTVYQQKDSSFLIPLYADPEREICIITKWKKEEGSIKFVSAMENLISSKYAILKVTDEMNINGENYLIGERFQADEAGQNHSLWVSKLLDQTNLKIMTRFNLGRVDSDTITKPLNIILKNQEIILKRNNVEHLILG